MKSGMRDTCAHTVIHTDIRHRDTPGSFGTSLYCKDTMCDGSIPPAMIR